MRSLWLARTVCLAYMSVCGLCAACGVGTGGLKVMDMTCEYLTGPLCVEAGRPRLAWKTETDGSAARGLCQASYRILVASSEEKLRADVGDLWDSGTVMSDKASQIVYDGRALAGVRDCYWKVRVCANDGTDSGWSDVAHWGTALADWGEARWIGDRHDRRLESYLKYVAECHSDPGFDTKVWRDAPTLPSPMMRKAFTLPAEVKRATLYVSAVGCYEMWINGGRVGRQVLAPEWTDYNDAVQYQAYDVTDMMCGGGNVIAATLSDGWALGRLAGVKWMRSFPHRGFYATDRRLIARLEVEMADGARLVVPTDGTWKINTDGYILSADNFAGQCIDARKIPPGWRSAGFDDSDWAYVCVDTLQRRNLVAQRNEPIEAHAELHPVRIWERAGKWMADFGQNIAGHCVLSVKGDAGRVVTVRHGEWLNDDGSLYTQSLGYAKATDRFVLSGGDDTFSPSMTYHGFQYVEIDGLDSPLRPDMIVARATASTSAVSGSFGCSDDRLNRLYRNIVWTQRNNMQSVLTDNPSRDERTGAMGDIQIFAQSSIFNMDMAAFYTKYLYDMKDVAPNGQFYSMIPSLRNRGRWDGWIGAPGWCEAGLIVPWRLYENYGDTRALETLYDEMCRHIEATYAENPGLIWRVRHNHNGDWLNANTVAPQVDPTYDTSRGATPDDLFATAFFAYSTQLLADISEVLHRDAGRERYASLAARIRDAFVGAFVGEDGIIEGDTQGVYSLALYYGLVPEELRERCFAHLLRCIDEYGCRLSTGFITTPMMMQTLSDFGRSDIAYRLLTSTRFPSWLYIVGNGATTVWERWDAWIPGKGFQNPTMNSLDHVAFGSVAEWMYRHILGINPDAASPGYAHFTLSPEPGGGLMWAGGHYDSIRGTIRSYWSKTENGVVYRFTIPFNTRATVILPIADGGRVVADCAGEFRPCGNERVSAELGSGTYEIHIVSVASL